MKLAFCLFKYFPYGGLQRDFLRIARACLERGHEVHIFTMAWEGEVLEEAFLHLLPSKGMQNHVRIAAYITQLKQGLERLAPDLVIGFNKMPYLDIYYAADVCYQHRVKQKHSPLYRLLPRYRQYRAWESAVFAAGQSTKILLIAAREQAVFTQYYQTEAERFHVLPPGIAKERLAPANAAEIRAQYRIRYGISSDLQLLLMVGSGFKTKGLDRALHAIAALPDKVKQTTVLFVIGQDEPRPFVKLAKQLQITQQVQFLGGRDDVTAFLLAADLLIHPAYHENTGTVLLEALAAGLPVLTLDTCGYASYITAAQAGCVLSGPFKQVLLNQALQEMLERQDKQHFRQNALSFAKHADIYSMPEKAAAYIHALGEQYVSAR